MEQDTPGNASFSRRAFLRATGIGLGFAAVAAAIGGGLFWWHLRPRTWDAAAVTASFDSVDIEGEKQTLVFFYTVENHTDRDYKLEGGSSATIAARLKEQGSLSPDPGGEFLSAEFPLFVPAHEKVLYRLHLGYPYRSEKPLPPDRDRKTRRAAVAIYVAGEFTNLDGFVLLDEMHRYKILFPKGW